LQKVFLEYDISLTNSLDAFELRAALNSSGLTELINKALEKWKHISRWKAWKHTF